jgi:hypothetical protein
MTLRPGPIPSKARSMRCACPIIHDIRISTASGYLLCKGYEHLSDWLR